MPTTIELKPALAPHSVVPSFVRPAAGGKTLNIWSYNRKRNLVILFPHSQCLRCAEYLRQCTEVYPEWIEQEAVAIVVVPGDIAEAEQIKARLRLPFEVVADDGSVRRRYLPADRPAAVACFVTDRYGGLNHQSLAIEADELTPPVEISEWLQHINYQCSECFAPEWSPE